ncbi:restriction endonuclease subunit S [Pontibacter anaerobius]|uniref:Restriction endonuclease subunit S n=1 Tax=Pontibacter anaerobius TaxID=2993940 RepID=A0ABT3RJK8_9BACT|nr:restriction endonuclease subunit S [Pontibacter anaerobius]MCX2741995.1 restriction endonuclease subunit S [Pontibacter anaerobius]
MEAAVEITTEVKNVPALRFPEFNGEWKEVRLEDICDTFKSGESITSKDIADSGEYPVYGGNGLRGYTTKYTHDGFYTLIGRQGALCGNINRVYGKSYISEHAIAVSTNNSSDTEWLAQKLDYMNLNRLSESSAQPGLAVNKLLRLKLKVPVLHEQQKIASFLSAVDEKIKQLSKKKELLKKYKKGVMQQLFSQQIRFKDDRGNAFPEWEEKKLVEVLSEHKGRNTDLAIEEVFSVAKEKGVVNQIEHLGRSYASNDISNYKVVYPDDVIYTKSPTSDFPYGIIKQNKLDRIGVVSVLYAVFKPVNRNIGLLLDYYFSSWVNTYNYLNPLVQKGAKNTMNINNSDFLNGRRISLPSSLEEQEKIANFLTSIDSKINHTSKQLEQAQQFKKGLLQQLFV